MLLPPPGVVGRQCGEERWSQPASHVVQYPRKLIHHHLSTHKLLNTSIFILQNIDWDSCFNYIQIPEFKGPKSFSVEQAGADRIPLPTPPFLPCSKARSLLAHSFPRRAIFTMPGKKNIITKFESKSARVKGLAFHHSRPWVLAVSVASFTILAMFPLLLLSLRSGPLKSI